MTKPSHSAPPIRLLDVILRLHPSPGWATKKAPRNSIPLRVIRFTALRSPPGNRRGGNLGEHRRRVADQELIKIERVFQIIIRRRRKTAGGRTFDEAALAGSLSRNWLMSPARSAPERNRRARPAAAAGAPRRSAHRADGLPIPFRLLAPDIRPPSFCNRNSSRKIACPSRNVGI